MIFLDGFNLVELLCILIFLFLLKNLGVFVSFLVMMLLSLFGCKFFEDFFMYLFENFILVVILECFECLVSIIVFEFFVVEYNYDECKGIELKSKERDGKIVDMVEIENRGVDEYL